MPTIFILSNIRLNSAMDDMMNIVYCVKQVQYNSVSMRQEKLRSEHTNRVHFMIRSPYFPLDVYNCILLYMLIQNSRQVYKHILQITEQDMKDFFH